VVQKKSLTSRLEEAAKDPAVRAVAASTAVAGGALAGKLVRDRVERTERRQERRYQLGAQEAVSQEIKRVLAGQLANAIDLLGADPAAASHDAVHDARKSLKRGRAVLRLGRDLIGPRRYRRENLALRDAGRGLSGARDSQVLLETLDGLAPPDGFDSFRAELAAAAQGNGDAPQSVVDELRDARGRVVRWRLADPDGADQLAHGFERIYRRGRKALRAASRDPSVENLHELRKRSKDLWYAAQLLRDCDPERTKALAGQAHELSDLLGSDHDLALLRERALSESERLTAADRELLEDLIDRRRRRLRRQALDRASRLYRRKPRKLTRRLGLA
jgi:CHAD domain-containing protein